MYKSTKKPINSILICLLALLTIMPFLPANNANAQQTETNYPLITMPVEYINYTILEKNGVLWAKIDGLYPLYFHGDLPQKLPMVYPIPPETTNITLRFNDQIIGHTNFTDTYPSELHHTAIGDWAMIATTIDVDNEEFTLRIHYEHPLEIINSSALFLYDLNISPYLSQLSNSSTAYFTIRVEANTSITNAFTTETDIKWNPINYTITEKDEITTISIILNSKYDHLLGDLIVIFSESSIPEYNFWATTVIISSFTIMFLLLKIKNKFNNQRIEQNSYS